MMGPRARLKPHGMGVGIPRRGLNNMCSQEAFSVADTPWGISDITLAAA